MFGSHLSISGGMHLALLEAEKLRFSTVQVFTKNQQQWQARPLDPAAVATFRQQAERLGFEQMVAHDSYLINLAAVDDGLRSKSMEAFAEEMRRCDALGIRYLVTHPGAHCGQGEETGLRKVVEAFRSILQEQPEGKVTVCVESTAGQGSCLGHRFEHLRAILDGVGSERMGVCLDTCHLLAAGYDLTTADGTRQVIDTFERVVGLKPLKVWHLNDSKKPLGSHVDRHEHIGRGCVGLAAFGVICADERFRRMPKILETPKDAAPDGRDWDEVNLEILESLAAGREVIIKPFELTPAAELASKPTRTTKASKRTQKPV